MNILGQDFEGWVTKQVNLRQASLNRGSGENAKDTLYQQSKTPWIRLASSIDVDNDGGTLAKSLILQGGTTNINGTRVSGLTSSTKTGVYGWGGINQRGQVPMPGITNASVKFINNGALSKSEISIKCYSKQQFELIDKLYMRPGYTLLLEFGWSVYLDTNGNLQSYDGFSSPALRSFMSGGSNQYDIIEKIKGERKIKCGNYEGIFGKVTNFKWNFNPDGSYDITVDLVGIGDVIETLKINSSLNKTEKSGDQEESTDPLDGEFPLINNATKDSLSTWLYGIYSIPPSYQVYTDELGVFAGPLRFTPQDGVIEGFAIPSKNYKQSKDLVVKNAILQCNQGNSGVEGEYGNPNMFITFGFLIAWLQQNIMLKSKTVPNCAFDLNFEYLGKYNANSADKSDLTLFNCPSGNLSANPRVCLIPFADGVKWVQQDTAEARAIAAFNGGTIPPSLRDRYTLKYPTPGSGNNSSEAFRKKLVGTYEPSFRYDDLNGRLSQVLLNTHFIAKCLDESPEDDDGAKSVLDFLNLVLSGMNKATGSINDITVKLNQDSTKIQFIENSPQKLIKEAPSTGRKPCKFNTFGKGSFIRNVNLDGSIPSNFATMVTIGAQANGNQTGGNSTSFSKYNAGLIDRIIPEKTSEGDDSTAGGAAAAAAGAKVESQLSKLNQTFLKITANIGFFDPIRAFFSSKDNSYQDCYSDRQWAKEYVDQFQSLHGQFMQLLTGYLQSPISEGGVNKTPASFFLPFNLSLEMDGISGIRLYETFRIDGKVLPPAYDENKIKLIIKGTDHKIDGSAWTTTLNTQSTPTN
tara:strand:+ start:4454 stop:6868 length:2415 start_codon:yes stop_codon:yes gene_type:complete